MADPRALRHRRVQLQVEEEALDRELAGLLGISAPDTDPYPAKVRMDPARLETEQRERSVAFTRRVVEAVRSGVSAQFTEQVPGDEAEIRGALADDVAEALIGAGYDDWDKIRAADEEELVALDGIGPKRARRIKEAADG